VADFKKKNYFSTQQQNKMFDALYINLWRSYGNHLHFSYVCRLLPEVWYRWRNTTPTTMYKLSFRLPRIRVFDNCHIKSDTNLRVYKTVLCPSGRWN